MDKTQPIGRNVSIKRVYDPPEATDGVRVLIDRLWPRGLSHERAQIDHWLKELAPSSELRTWFGHDPARFAEFRRRYLIEIEGSPAAQEALAQIRSLAAKGTVTMVYGARDTEHNDAVVLLELLRHTDKDA